MFQHAGLIETPVLPERARIRVVAGRGHDESCPMRRSCASSMPTSAGFADGHVKFISETIDRDVWRCLGAINDGQVIAADY
jgi:hypothetical protein